jgi:hypothetical protein
MNCDTDSDKPEAEQAANVDTDWLAILSSREEDGADWITVTPERVAVMSLEDCADQLERSTTDIDRLALAAKAAHLALQAALIAALAGSANIGAHPRKLRVEYLQYLEDERSAGGERPASDRVMAFHELLAAATEEPLPWTGAPLAVTDEGKEMLGRLTHVRHAVEHPKQSIHSIEPRYVAEALPIAAELVVQLLGSVSHHLEAGELNMLQKVAARIQALSAGHVV